MKCRGLGHHGWKWSTNRAGEPQSLGRIQLLPTRTTLLSSMNTSKANKSKQKVAPNSLSYWILQPY